MAVCIIAEQGANSVDPDQTPRVLSGSKLFAQALSKNWNKSIRFDYPLICLEVVAANRVDPAQMPHCAAFDLGLHCFLRSVYHNT